LNLRCFVALQRQPYQVNLPKPTEETSGFTNLVSEEIRSQAIRHVNGTIFEKSYRNQVVDGDIVSAFLETPSDKAIMKLISHLLLTRDLNAPAEPTSAQRRKVQADPDLVVARSLLYSSTKALRDRYGSVAAARIKAREDLTV
jgi:Protein of unknown function (DUF3435)